MDRNVLVAEAIEAGRVAKHNLQVIRNNPEAVKQGERQSIEDYLEMVISAAENEKVRLAGRTGLRAYLKSLLSSIVILDRQKRKEGTA